MPRVILDLEENEAALIALLLEQASDEFANHGCNDYELPAEKENIQLQEEMEAHNVGLTAEEFRKSKHFEDYSPPKKGAKTMFFMDWWLMSYLSKRVSEQLKAKGIDVDRFLKMSSRRR